MTDKINMPIAELTMDKIGSVSSPAKSILSFACESMASAEEGSLSEHVFGRWCFERFICSRAEQYAEKRSHGLKTEV